MLPKIDAGWRGAGSGASVETVKLDVRGGVFRCRNAKRDLAVKVYGPAAEDGQRGSEFAALRRIVCADPQQASLAVARPVAAFPALGVLVTEWLEAPTLSALFACSSTALAVKADALARTTRWLLSLYAMGRARSVPLSRRGPLRLLPEWSLRDGRTCERAEVPRGFDELVPYLDAAEALAARLARQPTSVVELHGDAAARNFLVSGDGIVGLDLTLGATGSWLHEPLRLYLELALRHRGREARPSHVRRACAGFAEVIAGSPLARNEGALDAHARLTLMALVLRRWLHKLGTGTEGGEIAPTASSEPRRVVAVEPSMAPTTRPSSAPRLKAILDDLLAAHTLLGPTGAASVAIDAAGTVDAAPAGSGARRA